MHEVAFWSMAGPFEWTAGSFLFWTMALIAAVRVYFASHPNGIGGGTYKDGIDWNYDTLGMCGYNPWERQKQAERGWVHPADNKAREEIGLEPVDQSQYCHETAMYHYLVGDGKGGRADECSSLEKSRTRKRSVGSNSTPSSDPLNRGYM